AESARADLAAIELGRERLRPGFNAAQFPGSPFITMRADAYLDAAADYGSPAYSLDELAAAQLVQLYGTDLEPADAEPALGTAPRPGAITNGDARPDGACIELLPHP